MATFGQRLKELRLEKKLKQEDIANLLGKSKNNISQYERDIRQTDDDTKKTLSEYFDVSIDYLIGNTDFRKNHKSKDSDRKRELIAQKLDEILEKNGVVKPGEDLSDDQVEWLMRLVDKAIEMNKMN